ncbi:hypothetical protein SNE40_007908 [Patella caerulea]|uniref:Reverse transcriptase domain-containing protein n=1 Tax=Patella caerulea TaxID=87958 RepID=A0AAN8PY35_PATCE
MRSSPQACQRTTNAVSYMLWNQSIYVVNYVDDFGGVSDPLFSSSDYYTMLELLRDLGLHINVDKCVSPFTVLTFLGKEYNTVDFTVCIPELKISETLELLIGFRNRKRCSLHALQQLIGKLSFVAECVRSGRLFITRMLVLLRSGHNHKRFRLRLSEDFQKDINWWIAFLREYNGISLIPEIQWGEPDTAFSTDASLSGLGGICFYSHEYFHCVVPESLSELHISALEMYSIFIALKLWAPQLANKRVRILCDNQACMHILNNGTGRDANLLELARQIWFICANNNLQIRVDYVTSADNRLSDCLSRWSVSDNFSQMFYNDILTFPHVFSERYISPSMFTDVVFI